MIIALDNLESEDTALFGTKAAFMGLLAHRGISIPSGFALSVEFFEAFLEYNDIPFQPGDFLDQNRNLMDRIEQGSFPESRKNILVKLFTKLTNDAPELIIRSSALCQDNADLSFSNIFKSTAHIRSVTGMFRAIKTCFASLLSDASLHFAEKHSVSFAELKMGIIIQKFIPGCPSGSIFSAGADNFETHPLVIQWVTGSSEDYLNAHLPRHHLLLSRRGKITVNGPGLDQSQLKQLRDFGLKSEQLIGYNQDLEWTYHAGKLYALQSRPSVKEYAG